MQWRPCSQLPPTLSFHQPVHIQDLSLSLKQKKDFYFEGKLNDGGISQLKQKDRLNLWLMKSALDLSQTLRNVSLVAHGADMEDLIARFPIRLKKTTILDLFLVTWWVRPPPSLRYFRAQIPNGDSWNGLKINQSREMCDKELPECNWCWKKPSNEDRSDPHHVILCCISCCHWRTDLVLD